MTLKELIDELTTIRSTNDYVDCNPNGRVTMQHEGEVTHIHVFDDGTILLLHDEEVE